MVKIMPGYIDGYIQILAAELLPVRELLCSQIPDVCINFGDYCGFFENRNEISRGDHSALRMDPAYQSLGTKPFSGGCIDLWLQEHYELVIT